MIQIAESEYITSATKKKEYPETPFFEIAFCGKSNVGKSSLINALLMRKKIAKTSSTPGKTRLINFFNVRVIRYNQAKERVGEGNFILTDLPGYGYAKVSKDERERWKYMIDEYLNERTNLRLMLLLIDIRHDADPKDLLMKDLLSQKQIPFIIAATKSDKVGKNVAQSQRKKLSKAFGIDESSIIAVSSLKKTGIEAITTRIEEMMF